MKNSMRDWKVSLIGAFLCVSLGVACVGAEEESSEAAPAAAPAASGDLLVSDVLVSDDGAAVTLNDAVQIREIKVMKTEGRVNLRFPEYVAKSGKAFPQVSVQSKKVYDAIANAISSGKPSAEKVRSIKFTITDLKLLRSATRKANVEVTFNDAVSITIGVMKSNRPGKDPFWISYPSRKPEGGGRFVNQIVITNPKLKKALEDAVIAKFQRAVSEQGGGNDGSSSEE